MDAHLHTYESLVRDLQAIERHLNDNRNDRVCKAQLMDIKSNIMRKMDALIHMNQDRDYNEDVDQ
jgi:hypothetical protein